MKKLKRIIFSVSTIVSIFMFNMLTFATGSGTADVDAPTLTEVRSIVGDGLDLFFGALGAFAVIMGGIEFYRGFMAYKDSQNKGGYGESKSNFVHHVIAGALCLIGAVLVFVVLGWAKDLFSI
jgi:hypothetical protein